MIRQELLADEWGTTTNIYVSQFECEVTVTNSIQISAEVKL